MSLRDFRSKASETYRRYLKHASTSDSADFEFREKRFRASDGGLDSIDPFHDTAPPGTFSNSTSAEANFPIPSAASRRVQQHFEALNEPNKHLSYYRSHFSRLDDAYNEAIQEALAEKNETPTVDPYALSVAGQKAQAASGAFHTVSAARGDPAFLAGQKKTQDAATKAFQESSLEQAKTIGQNQLKATKQGFGHVQLQLTDLAAKHNYSNTALADVNTALGHTNATLGQLQADQKTGIEANQEGFGNLLKSQEASTNFLNGHAVDRHNQLLKQNFEYYKAGQQQESDRAKAHLGALYDIAKRSNELSDERHQELVNELHQLPIRVGKADTDLGSASSKAAASAAVPPTKTSIASTPPSTPTRKPVSTPTKASSPSKFPSEVQKGFFERLLGPFRGKPEAAKTKDDDDDYDLLAAPLGTPGLSPIPPVASPIDAPVEATPAQYKTASDISLASTNLTKKFDQAAAQAEAARKAADESSIQAKQNSTQDSGRASSLHSRLSQDSVLFAPDAEDSAEVKRFKTTLKSNFRNFVAPNIYDDEGKLTYTPDEYQKALQYVFQGQRLPDTNPGTLKAVEQALFQRRIHENFSPYDAQGNPLSKEAQKHVEQVYRAAPGELYPLLSGDLPKSKSALSSRAFAIRKLGHLAQNALANSTDQQDADLGPVHGLAALAKQHFDEFRDEAIAEYTKLAQADELPRQKQQELEQLRKLFEQYDPEGIGLDKQTQRNIFTDPSLLDFKKEQEYVRHVRGIKT